MVKITAESCKRRIDRDSASDLLSPRFRCAIRSLGILKCAIEKAVLENLLALSEVDFADALPETQRNQKEFASKGRKLYNILSEPGNERNLTHSFSLLTDT